MLFPAKISYFSSATPCATCRSRAARVDVTLRALVAKDLGTASWSLLSSFSAIHIYLVTSLVTFCVVVAARATVLHPALLEHINLLFCWPARDLLGVARVGPCQVARLVPRALDPRF